MEDLSPWWALTFPAIFILCFGIGRYLRRRDDRALESSNYPTTSRKAQTDDVGHSGQGYSTSEEDFSPLACRVAQYQMDVSEAVVQAYGITVVEGEAAAQKWLTERFRTINREFEEDLKDLQ